MAVILADTFDRPDSVNVVGAPEVGGPWTTRTGVWGINGNALYTSTANSDAMVTAPGAFNLDATIVTSAGAVNQPGFVFRWGDSSNLWLAQWTATAVTVLHKTNGVYTQYAASGPLPSVLTPTIRVVAIDKMIYVFRNGVLVVACPDWWGSLTTRTTVGLRTANTVVPRFDSITVDDAPTVPSEGDDFTVIEDSIGVVPHSDIWINKGRLTKALDTVGAP